MLLIFEVFVVFWNVFWYCVKAVFQLIVPPPKKDIEGQIVLVTGAGGGIGRQLSLEFAVHGAKLVLWDINKDTNEKTAAMVRSLGKLAHAYTCDCSSRDEIQRVAEKVKREVGDVDILVNNAGILNGRRLMNLKDDEIEKTIKINTLAHFWTIRAFLPNMLERNQGHIVNITSVAGSVGVPKLTDYCASKFGATGFNNSLLLELLAQGKTGIKVTNVQPVVVNTGLIRYPRARFPLLNPVLEPEVVAKKAVAEMLRDQPDILIPRSAFIQILLSSILPLEAVVVIAKFLDFGFDEHVPRDEKKSD